MNRFSSYTTYWYIFLVYFILFITLILFLWNISTAAPTNDESIYIVVGQQGLFRHDWLGLNASGWVGGYVKLYPVLSALSYQILGITGSRLLSVFFMLVLLEITMIFGFILNSKKQHAMFIGIVSSLVLLTVPAFWRVGTLATYDALSYMLFFLSIVFFFKTVKEKSISGKWFFFSGTALLLSYLAKYTILIYFPVYAAVSMYLMAKRSADEKKMYRYYFLVPVAGVTVIYGMLHFRDLITFYSSQVLMENKTSLPILYEIFQREFRNFLPWGIAGTAGMFFLKNGKLWLTLMLSGTLIIFTHVLNQRLETFDKHLLLSAVFFSFIAGMGIDRLLDAVRWKTIRYIFVSAAAVLLLYQISAAYSLVSEEGERSTEIETYLSAETKPTDRVLTESGASVMLKLAPKISPTYITTFDWFEYKDVSDNRSYEQAVLDGYFDFIELSKARQESTDQIRTKRESIIANLYPHYGAVLETDEKVVYKRIYD